MHEVEEKVKKLCGLKEKFMCCLESGIEEQGLKNANTQEIGEIVDMIKDLAEAEKDCWKACYYKSIVKSMKEQEEEGSRRYDDMPSGYNRNRYANGRFAPSGMGSYVSGYMPEFMMGGYDNDEMARRMGYSDNEKNQGNSDRAGNTPNTPGSRFGRSFDQYEDARRHYHESGSSKDKSEMDSKAVAHVEEAVATLEKIWENADPDLKRKMQPAISAMNKKLTTA